MAEQNPAAMSGSKLAKLIAKHKNTKTTQLPTDMRVLFDFLVLVVDIKYRNRYGEQTAHSYDEGTKTAL